MHLEREIKKLKENFLFIATLVEDAVEKSTHSFMHKDVSLAQEVIEKDRLIDQKEVELDEELLKCLALYQPVATDLRFLIGMMKTNNDLERVGDLAVNLAKRTIILDKTESVKAPIDIAPMGKSAHQMMKSVVESFLQMDKNGALEVLNSDHELDSLHRQMFQDVYTAIRQDAVHVESYIQYLSASRFLERMGDYATNIAEEVIYMVDGEIVRHQSGLRPDRSSTKSIDQM